MENRANVPPAEPPTILFIGQHEPQRSAPVTAKLLSQAQLSGYDLLTAPLTTTHFQSRILAKLEDHLHELQDSSDESTIPFPTISPLMPEDTDVSPDAETSALVGVVSPWIDLASPDPLIASISRQVFNLEVAYAAFCGLSNVIVQGPVDGSDITQFSRAILEGLALGPYISLLVLLPMTGELELEGADGTHLRELVRERYEPPMDIPHENDETGPDVFASWETWNTIRTVCKYSSKLTVALELPRQLPSLALQSRWYSEPVRILMAPHTTFLRNGKGYPVLSKSHQQLLTRFLRLRFPPWLVLADVDPIEPLDSQPLEEPEPTPSEAAAKASEKPQDPLSHLKYIRYLQQNQPSRPPIERFGQGYQDYIQSPLQPLTDNLESITYEVFEKDPVKYEWYERAVAAALKDIHVKTGGSRPIVVAVVGAGRGPLVTRVLRASKCAGIAVDCCAVEKNPNAHILIQRRNATDPLWNKQVHVYKSDMRSWPGPTIKGQLQKCDILVSELLGSFADNELSPECLDGVQHVLHPDHGVSIPQSYSAHFTPISTPRIYADLLQRGGAEKWETPAVVMLHQYDDLCRLPSVSDLTSASVFSDLVPQVKEAFSFSHPLPASIVDHAEQRAGGTLDAGGWTGGDGKNEHNIRTCKVIFTTQDRGVCHGLAGYFETVLYAPENGSTPIELSTNPITMNVKSQDMISWFPVFFPLKTPILVPDECAIEVTMWRQTDDRKVWYEWVVEVFKYEGRKKSRIAMSELHSSRRNGCLM